ncbi:UxaA family hydrolase [Pseudoponticoccus marisrubri]|uniref:SAF domain-containing protein n=1 Tax=Pseudoponticoccus marisrubri TaxID=1685382 RepID=A0A0W7WH11_9RHOB|nr:UxaA family hydrolase [Pseudoponticoccus marisrubri]KUF09845.1 hypothetical protein AVJ23_15480 [Pseudoponticoccus marisrubri]
MTDALCLSAGDDVANLLGDVRAGDTIRLRPDGTTLVAAGDIPCHHKIALRALAPGAVVTRNGIAIGTATCAIAAGAHVHIHNLRSLRARPASQKDIRS